MKMWTIRTKDMKPIVFDEKEQFINGEFIEFHFPEDVAKKLLIYLKLENPNQEFTIYEEEVNVEKADVIYTEDDVHQMATEGPGEA